MRHHISMTILIGISALSNLQAQTVLDERRIESAVVGIESNNSKHSGSGIVISQSGLLLTSDALTASGASSVTVIFCNGRHVAAKVVASDRATEACLLQLPADDAPYAYLELADSSHAVVGQTAFTAANAFDAVRDGQVALSTGIVSGIYAVENASQESNYRGVVIETDAAVNPGSAGGALLNENGRVLGMLSMCLDKSRRLGTAIPIHRIKTNIQQLDEHELLENTPTIDAAPLVDGKALIRVRRGNIVTAGVMIDAKGLALTCAANLASKDVRVEVEIRSGRVLRARTVSVDRNADIALLQVEVPAGESLDCIALKDGASLRMGSSVGALGLNAGAFSITYDRGIVSAIDRIGGACQTDLKVNAGNYGGPVLDCCGRLIGIVSHFDVRQDWSQPNCGIGFFTSGKVISARLGIAPAQDSPSASPPLVLQQEQASVERLIDHVCGCVAMIGDGSGVIVSPDGYLLTCAHCVQGQTSWPTRLGDKVFVADVIETDSVSDLSLLKLRNAVELPYAQFANESVEIGARVLAAGDPFKLGENTGTPAFSLGIVSALHRNQDRCKNAIQTDAAINPGSSGGPLFTSDGKLLGLNGQIRYRFQAVANTGIGFATPCSRLIALLSRHQAQFVANAR